MTPPIPPRRAAGTPPPIPPRRPQPPAQKPEAFEVFKQDALFQVDENWRKEWQGMPEFNQEEQKPFMSLHVHFESFEAALEFGRLIGQKITDATKFLWHPKAKIKSVKNLRYATEDQVAQDDPEQGECSLCGGIHPGYNCPADLQ